MKKIILGLFLILAFSFHSLGSANVYLKGQVELLGNYPEIKSNLFEKGKETKFGGGIGLEFSLPVFEGLEMGVGAGYVAHNKVIYKNNIEKSPYPYMRSTPIYLFSKLNLFEKDSTDLIKPFLKVEFGYSFNEADYTKRVSDNGKVLEAYTLENGTYSGVGFGLEIENIVFDIIYSRVGSELNQERTNKKYDYSHNSLKTSIGIKFEL